MFTSSGQTASVSVPEETRSTFRVRRRTVLVAPPTSGLNSAPSSTTKNSGVTSTSKLFFWVSVSVTH